MVLVITQTWSFADIYILLWLYFVYSSTYRAYVIKPSQQDHKVGWSGVYFVYSSTYRAYVIKPSLQEHKVGGSGVYFVYSSTYRAYVIKPSQQEHKVGGSGVYFVYSSTYRAYVIKPSQQDHKVGWSGVYILSLGFVTHIRACHHHWSFGWHSKEHYYVDDNTKVFCMTILAYNSQLECIRILTG